MSPQKVVQSRKADLRLLYTENLSTPKISKSALRFRQQAPGKIMAKLGSLGQSPEACKKALSPYKKMVEYLSKLKAIAARKEEKTKQKITPIQKNTKLQMQSDETKTSSEEKKLQLAVKAVSIAVRYGVKNGVLTAMENNCFQFNENHIAKFNKKIIYDQKIVESSDLEEKDKKIYVLKKPAKDFNKSTKPTHKKTIKGNNMKKEISGSNHSLDTATQSPVRCKKVRPYPRHKPAPTDTTILQGKTLKLQTKPNNRANRRRNVKRVEKIPVYPL